MKKRLLAALCTIVFILASFVTTTFAAQSTKLPVTLRNKPSYSNRIDETEITYFKVKEVTLNSNKNSLDVTFSFAYEEVLGCGSLYMVVNCYNSEGRKIKTLDLHYAIRSINIPIDTAKIEIAAEYPSSDSNSYVCADKVKLYAANGKEKEVTIFQVPAYEKVGWYKAVKVINKDNTKSKYVSPFKLDEYEKVGWYKVVNMYAPDGRTKTVAKIKVSEYEKVGWYSYPVAKIYATDGRTKVIAKKDVVAYQKVGWYTSKPITVYSLDGRTKTIGKDDLKSYESVGWHSDPPVKMYALDGRTKSVAADMVEANKAVGWYTYPAVKLYALNGKTKVVNKNSVDYYQKNGWYLGDDYIDALVDLYGYNTAVKKLEKYTYKHEKNTYRDNDYYISDPNVRKKIENKITSLLAGWRASINAPIAIVGWSRSENSKGIPEINITFRNVSTKTIVSFENEFTCYDAYGDVTTDYPSLYTGTVTGWSDGDKILPGNEFSSTWTLYDNERTMKISWPKLLRVAFSDGTTWKK